MRYRFPAALLLAFSPIAANAQTDLVLQQLQAVQGTLSVQHAPQMADGTLTGCSLLYEFLQQDWIYLQGNFVRVSGNVSLMSAEGAVALTVKVVAAELDPALPDLFVRHLPPSRAYLVNADLSTNYGSLISSYPSDTEGGIFSVYNLEPGINAIFEAIRLELTNAIRERPGTRPHLILQRGLLQCADAISGCRISLAEIF